MRRKKVLSNLFVVLTCTSVAAAFATLVPFEKAVGINVMGYKSFCSFAPVSTVICLFLANVFYGIRKKNFV